jgi:hypothetical protein
MHAERYKEVGAMKEEGYCPNCQKMVKVLWDEDIDMDEFDRMVVVPTPRCSECLEDMPKCIDCRYFKVLPEDENVSINVARGRCHAGIVNALDFACPDFRWWDDEG